MNILRSQKHNNHSITWRQFLFNQISSWVVSWPGLWHLMRVIARPLINGNPFSGQLALLPRWLIFLGIFWAFKYYWLAMMAVTYLYCNELWVRVSDRVSG